MPVTLSTFFEHKRMRMYPVFVTNKAMKVDTFVWYCGESPHSRKKRYTIPAGTELVINGYSNFGDGYSMQPVKWRKLFRGEGATSRWFKCLYKDMDFVEYRTTK